MENKKIRKPFEIWKVKGDEFKLKLSTGAIEKLERQYGNMNLVNPAIKSQNGSIPSLGFMLDILHGSLIKFHHGITRSDVANKFDDWVDDGYNQMDLFKLLIKVYGVSGLLPDMGNKIDDLDGGVEEKKL